MEDIVLIHKLRDVSGKDEFSYYGNYYDCPKCEKAILPLYKYCSDCGCKIEWIDANDK